jgi:hypothetical protein
MYIVSLKMMIFVDIEIDTVPTLTEKRHITAVYTGG